MSKLKIAVQKNGRLSEKSLQLLAACGITIPQSERKLKSEASNFPIEVLYLRDDDIPQYVEEGVTDIGIVGENVVWEKKKDVEEICRLGFASCKMSLAIPRDEEYTGLQYFQNKKIATSFPRILAQYLTENKIVAHIEELGGSVEIAPGIGLAQGIFDIVSTGSTLLINGLKEVEVVRQSEAIIISNKQLDSEKLRISSELLFRIKTVQDAAANKYILLNAPNEQLPKIMALLPGMKSPTLMPLALAGWSSLHTVIRENDFWNIISQLKAAGAEGILVLDIEKMIL